MSYTLEMGVEANFVCATCGDSLTLKSHDTSYRGLEQIFTLEPCELCLRAARDEGIDEGIEKEREYQEAQENGGEQ